MKKIYKGVAAALSLIIITVLLLAIAGCNDITIYNVNFDYDYEGNIYSMPVISGEKIAEPEQPLREGYIFIGWYSNPGKTTPFDFDSSIIENTVVYASWKKEWVFEAEFTYLENIFEDEFTDLDNPLEVIDKDVYNAGASNGYYVSYLYRRNATLEFKITAEEMITDAILKLRLTAEARDIIIKSEKWLVQVNNVNLNYSDIALINVPSIISGQMRHFDNWTITASLTLNKGSNSIKLITNNDDAIGGAMYSTAPIVDCLYIYTNTVLKWAEHYPDNTKNILI